MDITLEREVREETKVTSVSEARVKFDKEEHIPQKKVTKVEIQPRVPAPVPLAPKPKATVPEVMPKKKIQPVKKPVPAPALEKVKSPSPRLIFMDNFDSRPLLISFTAMRQ